MSDKKISFFKSICSENKSLFPCTLTLKNGMMICFVFVLCFFITYLFNILFCFPNEIPETIIIEHDVHRLDRFGPVNFGHLKHIELGLDCKRCHHDWDEHSYELPIGCINCHGKDNAGDIVSLRTAYLKQCLGCHMIIRADGKKTGPTVCTGCHIYKNY
ncbi:cytochrome c3 family protein [bacterium]|nr:cytochrome c3 family protein [bacterium]